MFRAPDGKEFSDRAAYRKYLFLTQYTFKDRCETESLYTKDDGTNPLSLLPSLCLSLHTPPTKHFRETIYLARGGHVVVLFACLLILDIYLG